MCNRLVSSTGIILCLWKVINKAGGGGGGGGGGGAWERGKVISSLVIIEQALQAGEGGGRVGVLHVELGARGVVGADDRVHVYAPPSGHHQAVEGLPARLLGVDPAWGKDLHCFINATKQTIIIVLFIGLSYMYM